MRCIFLRGCKKFVLHISLQVKYYKKIPNFYHRFILSAAHCACDQLKCKKDANGALSPDYNPKGIKA